MYFSWQFSAMTMRYVKGVVRRPYFAYNREELYWCVSQFYTQQKQSNNIFPDVNPLTGPTDFMLVRNTEKIQYNVTVPQSLQYNTIQYNRQYLINGKVA